MWLVSASFDNTDMVIFKRHSPLQNSTFINLTQVFLPYDKQKISYASLEIIFPEQLSVWKYYTLKFFLCFMKL